MNSLTLQKIKKFLLTPEYKFRNVIYALILGFVFAYVSLIVVYGVSGGNHILKSLFKQDFLDSKSTSSLFNKMVVLGLAGLAVAFGMKAGILNIGVSGQMTAGGFLGYYLISRNAWMSDTTNNSAVLAIMFAVVIVASMLTALLSGVLKAFFKVNEVISTIMINWIVVYFVKTRTTTEKHDAMNVKTGNAFTDNRFIEGHEWAFTVISILILISVALLAWIYLFKTRGGFKLIATGKSPDAAKYAGYNSKALMLITFAISGAFAGLAGYVYFFLSYNSIPGMESVIQEGFMGIAVALVAMVNPLAIIPASILFGILTGPIDGIIVAGFAPNSVEIFSGVITYFVAITTLFLYLRPINIANNMWVRFKFRDRLSVERQMSRTEMEMGKINQQGGVK